MRTDRFFPEAETEVREAVEWYREQSAGLEYEFVLCVDDAVARICRNPEQFPKVYRHLRRVLVKRFPYAIYLSKLIVKRLYMLLCIRAGTPGDGSAEFDIGFSPGALAAPFLFAVAHLNLLHFRSVHVLCADLRLI